MLPRCHRRWKWAKLVAYCEVSISRQEWVRQSQHIGWVDYIGTKEEYQRRGLGHALLLHSLRRLQDWGAEQAMLMTMGTNTTAQQAFKSVGFLPVEQGFVYKKQAEPR
jgi:ribosomal protein S18 acetylase RimI-like enzyme